MSQNSSAAQESLASWKRHEEMVEAFEQAWLADKQPLLEDFLPPDVLDRSAVLIELIRVDLKFRLKANEPARVEDYLAVYPALANDPPALIELILAEYVLRRRGDSQLTPAEYAARFPTIATQLQSRLTCAAETPAASNAPADPDAGASQANDSLATGTYTPETGPPPPVPDPRFPGVPGYTIVKELGHGGMGVVYLALHLQLDRFVALKMIRGDRWVSKGDLARFRIEAEAVARLKHPNIVPIYEIGEVKDRPFFSLEYVEHGSLDARIKQAPLAPREAARLTEILARAMQHAHQAQILHRDLKPANVLLAASDPALGIALPNGGGGSDYFTPRIADFGLAKRLGDESGQTQHGTLMGTPSYMAPEQLPDAMTGRLQEIGPAADVYALGAVLYDGLVGRPPFKGTTALETLDQLRSREPIPPRQLQPLVPRDLDTICLRCLQKAPSKRYASALDLADDLRRFLGGEPILARATPAWERAAKWARRKPALATLAGVGLVAVLALALAIGLYVRGLSQQLAAEQQKRRTQTQIAETRARAQQHEIGKDWRAALAELRNVQELLKLQPDLGTAEARDEIRQRLDDLEQRIAEEDQGNQARKRAKDFQPLRDEALFFTTVFTGLGPVQNRARMLAATRQALAMYRLAVEHDDAAGPPVLLDADRKYLEAAEHARLVAACYELLLIWADAEATGPPGQTDTGEASRARAEKALKLLALASRLSGGPGRNTRTFHRYEARFLAQSQGKPFDAATADQNAPAAAGRLDWFLAGMEWYRHERWAEAIADCAQVLQKHPADYWAHYVTALGQLRLGDWANARAELTTCLNLKQDFRWPQLLRGFAASEMGFKQKDVRLQSADFDAAEKDFNAVLERDPSKLAQYVGLANRGVLNIRRLRIDAAFQDLEAAVKVDANGIEAYLNLAVAHQGLGQWPQALEALNKAEKLAPYLPAIYESRARLHLKREDWQAARADFEQAIAREPQGSRSARLATNLVELGKLLDREKNYKAALTAYDAALRADPELGLAHRFRAETLLGMDRLAEAGGALDKYLKKAGQAPANVYYARGLVYAQAKEPMHAIEMYTLALAQTPDDADIRRQRGWAFLLRDAANLALEDFEACLRDRKDDLDALIGRGNARMRLRKLPEALEDARAARQRGPLSDRQSYHLARLYGQAAAQLELESATGMPGPKVAAARQLAGVKEEALDCLQRALQQLPAKKRAAFWREQVHTDPAFAALRATERYVRLALFFTANAVGDRR